jgi:hypothetical protein
MEFVDVDVDVDKNGVIEDSLFKVAVESLWPKIVVEEVFVDFSKLTK